MLEKLFGPLIRRKLNGYIESVNLIDDASPERLSKTRSVAVVGGGLGGIAVASSLAERGFAVTLFERNSYLGGKVGCWKVGFPDGGQAKVDHGFHAFFHHYYNLQAFLKKVGADRHLTKIDDYLVLAQDGRRQSFKNVATTPVLNIISLGLNGFYRFREVLLNPASQRMGEFVKYDEAKMFAAFDNVSFTEFAEKAKLPRSLRLVFHTFARAFFAPGDKLSMAELMKSFHFFYLSHDHGLLYDYFTTDYATAFIEPVTRHLQRHGVAIKLDTPINKTERAGDQFIVANERFDYLVVAADVVGTRQITQNSDWIKNCHEGVFSQLCALQESVGYAIYRIWLDRRVSAELPVFIITEKCEILDSVTFYHHFDETSVQWSQASGGGVYELHCYALPDGVRDEDAIKDAFLAELHRYFPELKGARVLREHLQVKHDFTAFHVGLHANRPGYATGIPGFYLAGDWVKIPTPAMLMEAAFTSGLLCANGILAENGLREASIYSVPRKGLMA